MSKAQNKRVGEAVECLIINELDLFGYADDAFDAVTGVRTMTPVKIKATRPTYNNGRSGRFRLRERQHDALDDEGGLYVFAVYEGGSTYLSLVDAVILSTDGVDRNISPKWYDSGKYEMCWSDVPGLDVPVDPVDGGDCE